MPDTARRFLLALLLPTATAWAQDVPASAPAEATKSLQAIVMEVDGKARWRPSADGAWRDAKVHDLLDPGAEIRTGLRSRLTMRVGRNATLLVDSGTTMELPRVALEGDTLRTTAMVRSGRVDFKVDKVGYANDFQVVTPQTTLAVRGTGFSLSTGPLVGAEVTGARTNIINAVEVRYVASNLTYFMSGAASSTSDRQDPVQQAWASTIGPPPVAGLLADKGQLEQQVAQGQAGNAPTNPQQFQQIVAAEANGLGGNGLIVAASQNGASDAIRDAAGEVTSSGGEVTPSGDFINRLKDRVLRAELRSIRVDGPAYTADAEQLASRSVTLSSAAGALEDAVDAITGLSPSPAGSGRGELVSAVVVLGDDLPRDFEKDAEKIERWADRAIFTEGPDGVPLRSEPTDRRGVVGALQNARAWSAADLDDAETLESEVSVALDGDTPDTATAIDRLQDFHDGAYRLWNPDSPDSGSPRPDTSPLLLALAMNERVQQRWQALSNDVYASLATSNESVRTATAQVMASLHEGQFGDVSSKWNQYIAEYRRLADAEGTAVAQQALDEVEAKATEAGRATEDALADAKAALERAGEARTLGQRVLLESVGGAQFVRAATIARLSQESVTGTWSASGYLTENGILQNALAISEAYRRSVDQAMSSGVVLPSGLRALDD